MQTATVTTHGESQSVELPKEIQINSTEVYVKRLGHAVLLIPKDTDPWDLMCGSLSQFTDDFMSDRAQPAQQSREGLFD